MKPTIKQLLSLLGILSLTVGCITLGAKKTIEQVISNKQLITDTVPPVLSQERISENFMGYNIDTILCRLTPEQFIKQYPQWLGLDENSTLKIDTVDYWGRRKDLNNKKQSYTYRYYFKGVPVGESAAYFKTYNNLVVYVGDWRRQVSDTIDMSVNFTPEQVQAMVVKLVKEEGVADVIRREGIDHILNDSFWGFDGKDTAVLFIQRDTVIATVGIGKLVLSAKEGQLWYHLPVWFSDDGDIIVERKKTFWVNPKTGKVRACLNFPH